jgi:hypothetical protein
MTESNDWAQRNYLTQLVRNTKRSCNYFNRYRGLLVPALALLVTAPELAAIIAGYAAIESACTILELIPDPAPEEE